MGPQPGSPSVGPRSAGYGSGGLPPPWYELVDQATPPSEPHPPGDVRPAGKGLFGSLLDRNFDDLATVKLLRMLYTLAILCVTGFNLVLFLFGWSLAAGTFWPFLGWTFVIGVPVMWLAELMMVRVASSTSSSSTRSPRISPSYARP
jgi:hypothetical protein